MTAFRQRRLTEPVTLRSGSTISSNRDATHIRLRLYLPQRYQQEPVISRLISDYGLVVNITGAMLGANTEEQGCLDLELSGTRQQLHNGLKYLQSLGVKLVGKANTQGDSWFC